MNGLRIWFFALPRALRSLIAVNVIAYLGWQILLIHIGPVREFVWAHLALNPATPDILFEPWQLITYAFLHLQPGLGGLLHILFNMLWLVWIGRDLEELQGPARLFGLYVLGAIGGALLTIVLHALFPAVSLFAGRVHGASGAVLAVMAGVALLYPYKQIALFLLGTVRLIHLVLGFLALDLLFLAGGGTSVSAHLGGVLTGFGFAKLQQRGTDITGWARVFFGEGRPRPQGDEQAGAVSSTILDRIEGWLAGRRKPSSRKPSSRDEPRRDQAAGSASVGKKETDVDAESPDIDQILDKISASGYDSLTDDEKQALLEASRR